jgi:hypothetical protein
MGIANNPFADCRRRSVREAVMLAASAVSVTRSRSVIISDLSPTGALLGGRDLPEPGDDLLVAVGSQNRMGTVRWRSGDKCGVRLDEPLTPNEIALMEREAAWATVTGWQQQATPGKVKPNRI